MGEAGVKLAEAGARKSGAEAGARRAGAEAEASLVEGFVFL